MKLRNAVALALALGAGTGVANADTVLDPNAIFSVEASYDFAFGDTTITVTNLSGVTENNVVITSPTTLGAGSETFGVPTDPKPTGTIAPGQSATYEFNENDGPFVNGAANIGLPDSTTYTVSANYLGATVNSNAFNPVTNLSGGYVDFLGTCWSEVTGGDCPASQLAQPLPTDDGIVAQGIAPVPLPAPAVLLLSGIGGLLGFARAKSRRSTRAA